MADYPPLIYFDEDTEMRLRTYIENELVDYYAEANDHVEDLMRWQRDYWAQPRTESPGYPYKKGGANIVIPLSAIAFEAVHARVMTTMFSLPQFVSTKAISPEWEAVEKPLERFLDFELLTNIKIRRKIESAYIECEKFGTMISKQGYVKHIRKAVRDVGGVETSFTVVTKDGAEIDAVADARFLMRHHYDDPQTAPWVGEEHRDTPYSVEVLERAGMFYEGTMIDPSDEEESKLKRWITASNEGTSGQETGARFEHQQQQLEKTVPSFPQWIDWHELWLAFDVDDDGEQEEIVIYYHRLSQTIMGARYNWHSDLRRPYRTGVYQAVEHRWRGLGICKMNEQFQKEVTIQHRQRLDNATLANIRMLKLSKLSGYGPDEPVFPGKMWFLDDMDHLDTVQLGEIYPSSFENEASTLIYSQQRTGVNEVTLGMPQVGTPGTATADIARIQEGNRKFDYVLANFRDFTTDVILDTVSNIQQFGPRNLAYFDTAENGQLVKQFFTMPNGLVKDGLLIQVRAVGQYFNKALDRQNWQQIAALLQQYFVGLIQLAEMAGNPEMMQLIVMKGMNSATEAMRQILETFDVRNIDRIIVRELEQAVRDGLANAGAGANGSGTPERTNSEQALAQLASSFNFTRESGNGGNDRLLNAGGGI